MRTIYILEFKQFDKLGREKQPKHVGVYKTLDDVETAKKKILDQEGPVSFQIYINESIF